MVYTMKIYVDGGCRNNGYSNAFGAAAAVRQGRWSRYWHTTKRLPIGKASSQRAEITAIILGLKMALEKADDIDCDVDLTLYSDSRYAVNCMNEWIYKWSRNGWLNARGEQVANQDLIKKASRLDDDIKEKGSVEYVWIPRSENTLADKHCTELLDDMEADGDLYRSESDEDMYY